VRLPLEEVRDAPEFIKAKAKEIANLLPDASFTVEQLRSEKKFYDPGREGSAKKTNETPHDKRRRAGGTSSVATWSQNK
jgi:hypothetical protein